MWSETNSYQEFGWQHEPSIICLTNADEGKFTHWSRSVRLLA